MLLFLFSCVMPMLDTSADTVIEGDDHATYEVSKVDRSISSSVKLVIKYDAVEAGHASGNYFKYGKHKFIMTAKQTAQKVVLQCWALPGSSGSIIFDNKGRAVGVLSAVAVEMNPWVGIPEIQENIVYAGRLDFITRKFLKEVLSGY